MQKTNSYCLNKMDYWGEKNTDYISRDSLMSILTKATIIRAKAMAHRSRQALTLHQQWVQTVAPRSWVMVGWALFRP